MESLLDLDTLLGMVGQKRLIRWGNGAEIHYEFDSYLLLFSTNAKDKTVREEKIRCLCLENLQMYTVTLARWLSMEIVQKDAQVAQGGAQ